MIKKISIILLFSLLFMFSSVTNTDSAHIIDYTITLYEGGNIEVQGIISSGPDQQVTLLVHTPGSLTGLPQSELMEHIAFIDQVKSTTNGTFLIRFTLHPKWQGQELQFNVGGTDVDEPLRKIVTIPTYPININSVENNSVRVGIDVYHLSSPAYTPDNVVNSLIEGGNTIYFKLGGRWYNLLDSRATSAEYFKKENAIDDDIVNAWQLDMWYPRNGLGAIKFDPVPLN